MRISLFIAMVAITSLIFVGALVLISPKDPECSPVNLTRAVLSDLGLALLSDGPALIRSDIDCGMLCCWGHLEFSMTQNQLETWARKSSSISDDPAVELSLARGNIYPDAYVSTFFLSMDNGTATLDFVVSKDVVNRCGETLIADGEPSASKVHGGCVIRQPKVESGSNSARP